VDPAVCGGGIVSGWGVGGGGVGVGGEGRGGGGGGVCSASKRSSMGFQKAELGRESRSKQRSGREVT